MEAALKSLRTWTDGGIRVVIVVVVVVGSAGFVDLSRSERTITVLFRPKQSSTLCGRTVRRDGGGGGVSTIVACATDTYGLRTVSNAVTRPSEWLPAEKFLGNISLQENKTLFVDKTNHVVRHWRKRRSAGRNTSLLGLPLLFILSPDNCVRSMNLFGDWCLVDFIFFLKLLITFTSQ